eukprot:UN05884
MYSNAKCKILITWRKNQPNSIYYPNSSWNEGRNLLLWIMLKFEESMDVYFDYAIFGDGDIDILPVCTKSNERWDGNIIRKPKQDWAFLDTSPVFNPWGTRCVKNKQLEDGGLWNNCLQRDVLACQWICDYLPDCTAWNT